ncbi:LruC domain-containing protein [Bacteroides sp. UBA939]|uniref:LruC domain-containing protein n=1 Tax=Bacteroides sp. UBA939 TaxID=1946092 RepID=UPI0025B988D7|nr:LruC domain-containing protein [Bacteroides sp. UBA939]
MRTLLSAITLAVASLFVVSCINNDVYDPNRKVDDDPTLDLSFSFALKTSKNISLSAYNATGKPGKGVLFNVYVENPGTNEGISHEVEPVYTGYTNNQGVLQARITVPGNVKQLYVHPVTSGYGQVQTVDVAESMSLSFYGVAFPALTETRAAIDVSDTPISPRYNINSPFGNNGVGDKGILIPGKSPLITSEELSTDFVNLVNSWYPEKKFEDEEAIKESSDLVVMDNNGTEVWITYIGDGNFGVHYSSLLYYNYKEGELTSNSDVYKGENNTTGLRMTMAFPNVSSRDCPSGIKVQLLYWDKDKGEYNTIFPKGTHIGFAFARSSYLTGPVHNPKSFSFSAPRNPQVSSSTSNPGYPDYELFYSTPALNGGGLDKANAIIRSCPDYNCIVAGMDARYWDDVDNDRDFNDVLLKITTASPGAIAPDNEIIPEPVPAFDAQHGTLAFEDLWPWKGDYDFNDLVVNYTYKRIKNASGINEIQLSLKPVARGGAVKSGFGIELPFSAGMIKEVTGAVLEAGNDKATLIVWDDTNGAFGGPGIINTYKSLGYNDIPATEVTITLQNPLTDAEADYMKFNPFVYVNGDRGHEIHLVDFAPTSKMDASLFGTGLDRSDASQGIYYRMDNTYPWALDIPRTSSSSPSWRYPLESEDIAGAYLNYERWSQDKTNYNWFDASLPGNADTDKLY